MALECTRYPGIYRRGTKYVAIVGYRDESGRNRKRWITAPTMKAARAARRNALNDVERGVQLDGGDITVETMVREWLAAHSDEWRPFTTRNYTSIANRYIVPELGSLRLREVTKRRIQSFLVGLPTPSVARYTHAVLSSAITWASTDQDYVANNAVRTVRRPRRSDSRRGTSSPSR